MQLEITVITVCFNSEKTIEKTIKSVLEQDISKIEYIVIDGASTDSTLNVIKRYEAQFHGRLRIISEPDEGWYDAMNKGVQNAFGKFIVFLNSDDYFDVDAIKHVLHFIKKNKVEVDSIVYGDSTNIYRNSKGEILYRKIEAPDQLIINDKALLDGMCGIRHQSMFIGKKVYENIGLLDLQYRLHADWDFLVKCVINNIKMYHLNNNLTFYSMYGASTNPNYKERHMLRKNNHLYNGIDWQYFNDRWGIKVIAKKIFGETRWNDMLFRIHTLKNQR